MVYLDNLFHQPVQQYDPGNSKLFSGFHDSHATPPMVVLDRL